MSEREQDSRKRMKRTKQKGLQKFNEEKSLKVRRSVCRCRRSRSFSSSSFKQTTLPSIP